MKKNKNIKNSGFTLVEALVAISIFSVSILALLSVLSQGIANTNYAKAKLSASYLAQEGIEYVRNIRDTFVLYDATSSQNGWNGFVSKLTTASCQSTGIGCYFDNQNINYAYPYQPMAGITMTPCNVSCPTLLYDPATGKYGYVSGNSSGFTRTIKITQVSANEIKIFSIVSWAQASGSYNITFSESLFNWLE